MPTTKHKPQHHRRNAKPAARPHRRQGIRNAAPPGSRRAAVRAAFRGATPELEETRFRRLGLTIIGTALGSIGGALATRWGFHPRTTAIVVGGGGLAMSALLTAPKHRDYANAGTGAFSAGASQLVLMLLKGVQDAAAAQKQGAPQTASKEPARPPQRQLAALPPAPHLQPGALDAAFERARSALAVDADGHAYAYGHDFG